MLLLGYGEVLDRQLGAVPVQGNVGELVCAHQVHPAVQDDDLGEDLVVGGLDEFVDQLRGQGVVAR
jgi:hypothetical protein